MAFSLGDSTIIYRTSFGRDFFGKSAKREGPDPTPVFETFVVTMHTTGAVKPSRVFECMTSAKHGWSNRASWLPASSAAGSEEQRAKSLEALADISWRGFLNIIDKLFPRSKEDKDKGVGKGRTSQTKRSTHGFSACECPARLDTILPLNLPHFYHRVFHGHRDMKNCARVSFSSRWRR